MGGARGKRGKPAQAAPCVFSAVLRSHCSVGCRFGSLIAAPCNLVHTFVLWSERTWLWFGFDHFQSSLNQPWEAHLQWTKGRQEPHQNANSKTHSLLPKPQDPWHRSETCPGSQTNATSPCTYSTSAARNTGKCPAAARAAEMALPTQDVNTVQQRFPSRRLSQTLARTRGQLPGLFSFYLRCHAL